MILSQARWGLVVAVVAGLASPALADGMMMNGGWMMMQTQQGQTKTTQGGGQQMQGFTIMNGDVYIEGQKAAPDARRVTAPSGTVYVIERNNGGVMVHTE